MRFKMSVSFLIIFLITGSFTPVLAQTRRPVRKSQKQTVGKPSAAAEKQAQADKIAKEAEEAAKQAEQTAKEAEEAARAAEEIARRQTEEEEKARIIVQQKRQKIIDKAQQINWLVQNKQTQQAGRDIDAFIQMYPKDDFANSLASDLYISLGDYVAAEYHLKQAADLTQDAAQRANYMQKLNDLGVQRETLINEWLKTANQQLDEMDYTAALNLLPGVDKLVLYHPKVSYIRGTLSGMYRKYENAVKIFNRMLEDPALDSETKTKVTMLRDYSLEKATAAPNTHAADDKVCRVCKAHISTKTAYCPVCLSFQPKIAQLKSKHATTSFNYESNGNLTSVDYAYYDDHTGSNTFGAILGGIAAGTGGSGEVTYRDPDDIKRNFKFEYEDGVLQKVGFESEAVVGGSTQYLAQSVGGVATTTKTDRQSANMAAFSQNETLVYANNPKIDAEFTMKALGQNVYRGFTATENFTPFWWSEPHILVFYYDKDLRVTKAVDAYDYSSEANAAGHRVVTGRKSFTGANRVDPLSTPSIFTINYNSEGLISSIVFTYQGKETYRREIVYGVPGIMEEREFWGGSNKNATVTKYKWNGNQLFSAKRDKVTADFSN